MFIFTSCKICLMYFGPVVGILFFVFLMVYIVYIILCYFSWSYFYIGITYFYCCRYLGSSLMYILVSFYVLYYLVCVCFLLHVILPGKYD